MLVGWTVLASAPRRDVIGMCANALGNLSLAQSVLASNARNENCCIHATRLVKGISSEQWRPLKLQPDHQCITRVTEDLDQDAQVVIPANSPVYRSRKNSPGNPTRTAGIDGRIGLHAGVTGLGTLIGGMGHTLPFLITRLSTAMSVAYVVVVVELVSIAYIRFRYMKSPLTRTIVQVIGGGGIVFALGLWLGKFGAAG